MHEEEKPARRKYHESIAVFVQLTAKQTKILTQFTQLEIQLSLHGFSMIIIQFFVKIIS